jgi:hypothetical protein
MSILQLKSKAKLFSLNTLNKTGGGRGARSNRGQPKGGCHRPHAAMPRYVETAELTIWCLIAYPRSSAFEWMLSVSIIRYL